MNKMGYDSIKEVLERGQVALSVKEFEAYADQGALIIDTRSKEDFPKGYIPGSIFIGIDDNFAPWLGALVTDLKQPILLIADEDRVEEIVTRMSRVGYDNALGYLKGGFETWKAADKPIETINEISAEEFANRYKDQDDLSVLDVRKKSEFDSEHVIGAENFPLDFINQNMDQVDRKSTYFIHCAGGYRSMITSSILKSRGFENLVNIQGGFNAIKETNVPKTEYVEPTTML
jgi:rhodanese-related sulfurtransferase